MGLYEHWPYVNFHELNLNMILQEMKRISDEMEVIKTWHDDYQDELEHLEEIYGDLVNKYNDLEQDFNAFVQQINTDFEELETDLIARINREMNDVRNEMQLFENQVNYRLDGMQAQITALDRKIDNAIEHLADNLKIINPFTGELEPISDVINTLAAFHMEDAITAGDYDALQLTAGYYDGLQLTAYQYDVQARQFLQ